MWFGSLIAPAKKNSYIKHCVHLTVSDQVSSTLNGWLLYMLSTIMLYILRMMSNLTCTSTIPPLTACTMPAPYDIHHFHRQRVTPSIFKSCLQNAGQFGLMWSQIVVILWSFCGHFNRTKEDQVTGRFDRPLIHSTGVQFQQLDFKP